MGGLIRIVGFEAQHDVALRVHHERVSAHWHLGERRVVRVVASILLRANDGLEVVTM